MYAVIASGGKQRRVQVGDIVRLERIEAEPGESILLDRVLLVGEGSESRVGRPLVESARVRATVLGHDRGPKILVFKWKRRQHHIRHRRGHRQAYTAVRIDAIEF
jgi:large subunit ribosomal protein L21